MFDFGGEPLNGNCSVGQLTEPGFNQHLVNGGQLKKAYVDSGFLNPSISASEIYLRSDSELDAMCIIYLPLSVCDDNFSLCRYATDPAGNEESYFMMCSGVLGISCALSQL